MIIGIDVDDTLVSSSESFDKVKEKYDHLIDGGLLPLKRWGTPQDVADAVFVLCSGQLPYVIGQSVDVDGGFHIARL